MAYDEELAERFRDALGGCGGISEKHMMGGVCFLLNGNMIGGCDRTKTGERRFMFRVGKDNDEAAAELTGARPTIRGGRRMRGFYFVDADACYGEVMAEWLELALGFAEELPAK